MKDENADVRSWVAERIDQKFFSEMMKDENQYVRSIIRDKLHTLKTQ